MRLIFLSFALSVISGLVQATIDEPVFEGSAIEKPSNEVTLLFAGDAMQHGPQFRSAFNPETKTYDYSNNFKHLEPIIQNADIAVVNLETTLAGEPYSSYPQFSSPDSFAKQLHTSGFDIFMLANNHSNDRWSRGVKRTIQTLDKMGITHSGTYQSKQEHDQNSPLMIKKNGLTLAFLNYTFATNGIKSVFKEQTKMVSFNQMRKDIRQAKINKADSIIVYIHWGDEYQLEPSKYQKDVAQFLIDSKVDLIIGSHPHVVQKMVWQKNADVDATAQTLSKSSDSTVDKTQAKTKEDKSKKATPKPKHEYVLAYSLGNFISNQRNLQQAGGALLQVTLKKEMQHVADEKDASIIKTKTETKIHSAGYYLSFVDRTLLKPEKLKPKKLESKKLNQEQSQKPELNQLESKSSKPHQSKTKPSSKKYQYQVLPVRQFETKVDSINWAQYGMMLQYAVWASNFLNSQNQNVPEYLYKNGEWLLDARQPLPKNIEEKAQ